MVLRRPLAGHVAGEEGLVPVGEPLALLSGSEPLLPVPAPVARRKQCGQLDVSTVSDAPPACGRKSRPSRRILRWCRAGLSPPRLAAPGGPGPGLMGEWCCSPSRLMITGKAASRKPAQHARRCHHLGGGLGREAPGFSRGEVEPPGPPEGRVVLDVALVLDVLLDDRQRCSAHGGDEVGVGPQRGEPGAQGGEFLSQ